MQSCSVIASVNVSEPKQSIFLFLDKHGLLLKAIAFRAMTVAIFLLDSGFRRNDNVLQIWHYLERRAAGEQVSIFLLIEVRVRTAGFGSTSIMKSSTEEEICYKYQ